MAEGTSYAESIALPTDEIFRNLKNAKWFALDIGKSTASVAIVTQSPLIAHPTRPMGHGHVLMNFINCIDKSSVSKILTRPKFSDTEPWPRHNYICIYSSSLYYE